MHKKLASDLNSLAHDILKMRDKDDVFALKAKASELYEKLSVLAYVEEYLNTTPQAKETKEELVSKIEKAEELKTVQENVVEELKIIEKEPEKVKESFKEELPTEVFLSIEPKNVTTSIEVVDHEEVLLEEAPEKLPKKIEDKVELIEDEKLKEAKALQVLTKKAKEKEDLELKKLVEELEKGPKSELVSETKNPTLEDELQDTLSVDVMTKLFTKVEPKKSLNDKLSGNNTIQIGLNDRIAFVNHLFKGDQAEFNRVIRELNITKNEKEARDLINNSVKPNYDWSDKEDYETRLHEIIERKFN